MKKWAGRRWRRWNRQMLSVDERERQSSMSGIRRPWIVVLFLAVTTPLFSHITLDSPNGGEVFLTESTIPISWHITITHDLQNWDLWYSTVGSGGPWTPIAMDLAAGSSAYAIRAASLSSGHRSPRRASPAASAEPACPAAPTTTNTREDEAMTNGTEDARVALVSLRR